MRFHAIAALALVLGLSSCVTTQEPTLADHSATITIEDMSDWVPPGTLTPTLNTFDRKDQLGNIFLSYRYQGKNDEIGVVLNSEVLFARDEQTSKSAYRSFVLGSKIAKGQIEKVESVIDWGEQTANGHLMVDGKIRGHVYVGRRGTVTVMIALGGLYRDDPGDFERSLEPHLWALTKYDPLGRKVASY